MPSTKDYSNDKITIHWTPRLCVHSTICFRRLPGVFDPLRKPWVDPSGADVDKIREIIDLCPSGALRYTVK